METSDSTGDGLTLRAISSHRRLRPEAQVELMEEVLELRHLQSKRDLSFKV